MLLKPRIRPTRSPGFLAFPLPFTRAHVFPRLEFFFSSASRFRHSPPTVEHLDIEIKGQSGRTYTVDKILQRKNDSPYTIYRAVSGHKPFVLKEVPKAHFHEITTLHQNLPKTPFVRALEDTSQQHSILVYSFLTNNFLELCTRDDLSLRSRKQILRDALRGLAALHAKDYVHTDVKPNNILVECKLSGHGQRQVSVDHVQIADVEDACHVPPGRTIRGTQIGNWMWRSPEAHAQGPLGKPSDMFSFGLVCIYALTKRVVLAVDESELEAGEEILSRVIARQLSYFADADGLSGLLHHLGSSNPWIEVFNILADDFGPHNPRRPFVLWLRGAASICDEQDWGIAKMLIQGLVAFDPATRLTAEEALEHRWFGGI